MLRFSNGSPSPTVASSAPSNQRTSIHRDEGWGGGGVGGWGGGGVGGWGVGGGVEGQELMWGGGLGVWGFGHKGWRFGVKGLGLGSCTNPKP